MNGCVAEPPSEVASRYTEVSSVYPSGSEIYTVSKLSVVPSEGIVPGFTEIELIVGIMFPNQLKWNDLVFAIHCEPELGGCLESNTNVLTSTADQDCDPLGGSWANRGLLCRVYKVENTDGKAGQ